MSFLLILAMAGVATVVMAVGQAIYWAQVAKAEEAEKELRRRLGTLGEEASVSLFRERARDRAVQTLGSLGGHLQDVVEEADVSTTVSTLVLQMILGAAVAAVAGLVFSGAPGLMFGFIAGAAPYIRLRFIAGKRQRMLLEQLPEALDLMARSLQAGLGLNEAFRTCAEEMPLPIAAEFGRVFEEVRFGREYREAMNNLIDRNPRIFELRLFTSSLLLQRETGGNLIEILDGISNMIRGRFMFQAKVQAMTSEAKFSAMILGGLPLCVAGILTVMNPGYLAPLFDDILGNFFLFLFFLLYSIGGFIMYKVSQVEV